MKTTSRTRLLKPKVLIDADILFAGAASPSEQGASLIILRMAEITLIEAVTSKQVIVEVERNLAEKLPHKLPELQLLISRCLHVVPDPRLEDLASYAERADPKDVPILAAAVREGCSFLVTFNVRHFRPLQSDLVVLQPGEFALRVRELLAYLDSLTRV